MITVQVQMQVQAQAQAAMQVKTRVQFTPLGQAPVAAPTQTQADLWVSHLPAL